MMRKNSTLPSIRDREHLASSQQRRQTFRTIETKVNSHDQEIVSNQKIISSLANEFKLLKEQLQFEQEYAEKYKDSLRGYEQETARQLKIIKEQKTALSKLEHQLKEKGKAAEAEVKDLRLQLKDHQDRLAQKTKDLRKKEDQLKNEENEKNRLLKLLQERDHHSEQCQTTREQELTHLQNQRDLLKAYVENSRSELAGKELQIQSLRKKLKEEEGRNTELARKGKQLVASQEERKLLELSYQEAQLREKQVESKLQELEKALKTSKQRSGIAGKVEKEKKELEKTNQKLESTCQQLTHALEVQKKEVTRLQQVSSDWKEKAAKVEAQLQEMGKLKEGLRKLSEELGTKVEAIKMSIACEYCKKRLKKPVTCIPCGHSFCFDCKKGYEKQCSKCRGLKREAVYRNELLDEVVEAVQVMEVVGDKLK